MKLPRDLSGERLVKALESLGYSVTRQESTHVRLTTRRHGEHHVTIPKHSPLLVGTLSHILGDVAEHLGMSRDELLHTLLRKH